MPMMRRWVVGLLIIAAIAANQQHAVVTAATPPLEIENYKFFDSATGQSVQLKGVAYYPRPNAGEWNTNNVDFYHEEFRHIWERDIEWFQTLGINAIRIYAVDPSLDHSSFFCALQDAGIYVIVGLSATCPGCAITSDVPPTCYPPEFKVRGQEVIGTFIKYENVLGFDAGNEVGLVSTPDHWTNAPCQKKFLRDMRAYIAGCPNVRQVPVGVVLADIYRREETSYYNCISSATNDPYEVADWIGLNAYQHCDPSVTELEYSAGFVNIRTDFENFSIPVILTEYGCLNAGFPTINGFQAQRTFYESQWINSAEMWDTLAGGFVFEYSTELQNAVVSFPFTEYSAGNYGIGYFDPVDCDEINITCTFVPKPEFTNLQASLAVPSTNIVSRSTFVPASNRVNRSECPDNYPAIDDFEWEADQEEGLYCPGISGSMDCSDVSVVPTVAVPPNLSPTVNGSSSSAAVAPRKFVWLFHVAAPMLLLIGLHIFHLG